MSDYQLEHECLGCKATDGLRQVTVNDVDCTLCYNCEQKVIAGLVRGEL